MKEFLDSPMPFIFGMRSQDLPDAGSPAAARLLADIVLVDIDRGIIGGDFDELPRLPIEPLSKLFSRLRGSTRAAIARSSGRFKAHDARQTESHFDRMEDGARWAFLALWAELLCEYKEVYVIVCVCDFVCCACLSLFVFVNSLFTNDIEALVHLQAREHTTPLGDSSGLSHDLALIAVRNRVDTMLRSY